MNIQVDFFLSYLRGSVKELGSVWNMTAIGKFFVLLWYASFRSSVLLYKIQWIGCCSDSTSISLMSPKKPWEHFTENYIIRLQQVTAGHGPHQLHATKHDSPYWRLAWVIFFFYIFPLLLRNATTCNVLPLCSIMSGMDRMHKCFSY